MTPYQRRMSNFVWVARVYAVGGLLFLFFLQGTRGEWIIFVSTAVVLHALAHGFDAVYDSLAEVLAGPPPDDLR